MTNRDAFEQNSAQYDAAEVAFAKSLAAPVAAPVVESTKVPSFSVLKSKLPEISKSFEKLGKRAKKLGLESVPSFEVIGEHLEYCFECIQPGPFGQKFNLWSLSRETAGSDYHGKFTGFVRTVCTVTVNMLTIGMDGWSFLAQLDHELGAGHTVIRAAPQGEGVDLSAFRSRDEACDHCKLARKRKETYVLRHEDGRMVQVGSSCMEDFLGHDVLKLLGAFNIWEMARELLQDGLSEGEGGGGSGVMDLETYLSWVAKSIREDGWTSKGMVRDGRAERSTSDRVELLMEAFRKQG